MAKLLLLLQAVRRADAGPPAADAGFAVKSYTETQRGKRSRLNELLSRAEEKHRTESKMC